MKSKSKIAINLFKNLVKSGSNVNAIRNSMYNALEIDSKNTVKWFEELSTQHNNPGWYVIENSLFDLLPKITKINKKSGINIFNNLLKPEFEDVPDFLDIGKPSRRVKRNRENIWAVKSNILKLFHIAPKEFLKAVLELVLEYHEIPKPLKNKQIQDVYSGIWYYGNSPYEETNLLLLIEHESCEWLKNNDPRISDVLQYLEKTPNSLALRILTNILLCNPKKYQKKLFDLAINKIIYVDDCLELFPRIINSVQSYLLKSQIRVLNNLIFSIQFPIKLELEKKSKYQKFIASSIPKKYRTIKTTDWLQTEGKDVLSIQLREPPMVYSSIEESKKSQREKFSELNLKGQEEELTRSIDEISKIKTKEDKLDFLSNVQIYLNKNKSKVKKKIVIRLEPIIWELCSDSDPEGAHTPDTDQIKHSLISYPTVRAYAAGCLLPMMWHNPMPKTMSLVLKMANDKHSFVRESICRNLRYFAAIDYTESLKLAKKFTNDNERVLFFLTDYMNFNVIKHPDDILKICEIIIKKYEKRSGSLGYVEIMNFVASLVVQLSLTFENKKFEKLLYRLLDEDKFSYDVIHEIIFTCSKNEILFKTSIQKKVLDINLKLLDSKNDKIRSDAEFFLLHTLTTSKKSFWPEIKPFLTKLSKTKYAISEQGFRDFYIIPYLMEFWKQFPSESCSFIFNLYSTNPKLLHGYHRGRDTIELIGHLYKNRSISEKNKKNVMEILLEFIKAGWPEASMMLKTLESSN